jgi:predicted negative regulator of RcsB-dependent stress response
MYVSDKEEVEMLRNWWRENGKFTLASIAAALLLSGGWRYWQSSKTQDAADASNQYEQLLSHEANQQYSAVEYDVTALQTNHPRTPYATLGAFVSAQNAVNANKLDIAVLKLNWIIQHSKNEDFKQIARIRLAHVLLGMKKFDDALTTLNTVDSKGYLPLIDELKGDVHLANGDKAAARLSYQDALNKLNKNSPNYPLLQIKANQLGS